MDHPVKWEREDVQFIDEDVAEIVSFLYTLNQDEQDQLSSNGTLRFNGNERLSDAVDNVIQAYRDACAAYPEPPWISYCIELYETLMIGYPNMGKILSQRIQSTQLLRSSLMDEHKILDATIYLSECGLIHMRLDRVMSSLVWETRSLRLGYV